MNSNTMTCILSKIPDAQNLVRGIYANDTLPIYVTKYPSIYIVNTDFSYSKGKHWVLIYFDSEKSAFFFDSLGKSPGFYFDHFVNFLKINASFYSYNNIAVQQLYSSVCGYYVIFFVYMKVKHKTNKEVLSYFCDDKIVNDMHVFEFVQNMFSECM